ncbi:hypothetical protein IVB41_16090 [Bradyrhizobium sp. 44]|uniref:hypothetical protein n=1 Tax=Bradyrhizobium sp. 44 TaxID=2782675 RepID=UPI001FF94A0F|nr:hypothetical protein [Bradyrhizobium sp. 44]MCK1285440.1 hypothetical protein [Bradyrhizobium sp. 44]
MNAWKKTGWPITRRILGEVAIPGLCGIAWGMLAFYQGKTAFESVSIGFTAFFFIFFLQGQVLRVAKNVSDKQNAAEWRDSFATLKEGLDELRRQQAEHAGQAQPAQQPTAPASSDLMDEARASLANRNYYAAALTAAAAFEQLTRRAVVRMNVDPKAPLSQLVQSIAYAAKDTFLQRRLLTLVRLRNNLVHPQHDTPALTAEEAEQLIEGFEDGITDVENASWDGRGPRKL